MAYAWTKTITVGAVMKDEILTEINTVSDYIVANHCPSNCTSNKTSNNNAVNTHNSTVWSSDKGSHYYDNSYTSGYSGYWSSQNLGKRS